MKKIYQISLGCPKNLVDSEVMLGLLHAAGYRTCAEAADAEVLMVNTCGFIQDAVKEAIDTIFDLIRIKEENPHQKLVVTGCLVQRYGDELSKDLPEVDLFIGTEGVGQIVELLDAVLSREGDSVLMRHEARFLMNSRMPRIVSTPRHRAYLKVTEGCLNRCSYCLIPAIRGKQRSRSIDDLVCEAKKLAAQGVQELTLVAQDLTSYGVDIGYRGEGLEKLLEALLKGCNIPWIRLLYLYPIRLTRQLLRLIAKEKRLLPYLDIPLQHVSSKVLKAMNRPYGRNEIDDLVSLLKEELPTAALRTTFMVGFPGEKEEDVAELQGFMVKHCFDHVGIFAYSNEEGCAAWHLPEHCDEYEKQARRGKLMEIQREISLEKNKSLIGKTEIVLVEGLSTETDLLLEGRGCFQAPEIDGCIYIAAGNASPGEFVKVLITHAHPYDLVGETVNE